MLKTEERNPATTHIDRADTAEILRLIQKENLRAAEAVGEALGDIETACRGIERGMKAGGRLFYVGAGTSGRLGVLDAAECPPTYGVSPDLVVGVMAGGNGAVFKAVEGAEDNAPLGRESILAYSLKPQDTVVGISAAGGAAFVCGALEAAKECGCYTVALTSNPDTAITRIAETSIVTDTGAEVITGSTRMKAGTAQKMVLNMLSTAAMIRLGNVRENVMVNLRPTNEKLARRMCSIVSELYPCDTETARKLLEEHNWSIPAVLDR